MAYLGKNAVHAWLNYNGTNNSIRDDYNISSVSDNGTGFFTISFTDAFANTNYCAASMPSRDSTSEYARTPVFTSGETFSTTQFTFRMVQTGGAQNSDRDYNLLAFFGSDV